MIRYSAGANSNASVGYVTDGGSQDTNPNGVLAAPPMEPSMKCMAVAEHGPDIAFACFDEDRNEIIIESSHASDDAADVIERFIHATRPNLVLVNTKVVSNASFLEMITKPAPVIPGEESQANTPYATNNSLDPMNNDQNNFLPSSLSLPYRVLRSSAFEVRACRARILQKLRVQSLLRHKVQEHSIGYDDPGRSQRTFALSSYSQFRPSSYHALASIVDFDSDVQVRALGALLHFLQTTVFKLDQNGVVSVNHVLHAKSSAYMRISAATMSSLHIFATEHHPLIAKGPGNSKEGFSLYALLDRTQCKGGRQLLREWMMKPLADRDAIEERYDAVSFFVQPTSQAIASVLVTWLAKVGPIDKVLSRLQRCTTSPMDYVALSRTLAAASAIRNALQNDVVSQGRPADRRLELLCRVSERCFTPTLSDLHECIVACVDEVATSEQKTVVVVRQGFDPELDMLKTQFDEMEFTMEETGRRINEAHPGLHLSVVYVPQVGFLVALKRETMAVHSQRMPEDFEHSFTQDNESYFKCDEVCHLDDEIGDLDRLIKDREGMIVNELEETILDSEADLRQSFKALSELDCILSFSECAMDFQFVRPVLLQDGSSRIHIVDGRHPLQEIITERAFVPNDVDIDTPTRISVVTGPNYSGKSCYLRQVGVLVYMAHIGCFLPCSRAEMCIVDNIVSRISSIETCSVPQSSFQLDLTQMASILRHVSPKSLVLIDEFGKGTSPASGIAMLGSAMKKLSKVGCKAICTTHFLELFTMNVVKDGVMGIKAKQMSIQLPRDSSDDAIPLFRLEDGIASGSAGLICAKKAGVDRNIVHRAKALIGLMREKKPIGPWVPIGNLQSKDILSRELTALLQHFFGTSNWEIASDDDVRMLIQKVAQLASI
eukprot:Nitzschia sp. Nitz4//scaffold38_size140716//70331//73000//NITZ4_003145-RA/size140716-processed-gene-0.33-mRNA-1//1//CDS//3329550072//2876//frame0